MTTREELEKRQEQQQKEEEIKQKDINSLGKPDFEAATSVLSLLLGRQEKEKNQNQSRRKQ